MKAMVFETIFDNSEKQEGKSLGFCKSSVSWHGKACIFNIVNAHVFICYIHLLSNHVHRKCAHIVYSVGISAYRILSARKITFLIQLSLHSKYYDLK